MAKISVIMGIYNCENTLSNAIESIIRQTYSDWELIMCDDGSSDKTLEIASKYSHDYPDRIFVLKNMSNIRLAATLNRCLKIASGTYIARMDADDESMPTRLEEELFFLENNPEYDVVGTNRIVFDESGDLYERKSREYPNRNQLIKGAPYAHPTILMRKSTYDKLGGYTVSKKTMRAEDLDLWFRFYEQNFSGYNIQKPLYRYRESIDDFKKRNIKAGIQTSRVFFEGYKRLKYKKIVYLFALKPIITALIPNKIMSIYHEKRSH